MKIEQYLEKRRYWEFALMLLAVSVSFAATLAIKLIEQGRAGGEFDPGGPLALEATSHIAMALVIPLLLLFDRIVPVRADNWPERSLRMPYSV